MRYKTRRHSAYFSFNVLVYHLVVLHEHCCLDVGDQGSLGYAHHTLTNTFFGRPTNDLGNVSSTTLQIIDEETSSKIETTSGISHELISPSHSLKHTHSSGLDGIDPYVAG